MRRSALPLAALSALLVAAYGLAGPAPVAANSGGANPGFAGNVTRSDGTAQTCTVCHGSFDLNAGGGSVAIDAPPAATAADVVRVTVTLDNQTPEATPGSGRQGFQATVRDAADPDGPAWGTLELVDAATTRFSSSSQQAHVTHTAGGTGQTTWAFDWRPDGREGTARIFVAGNAANGDGGQSGDYIYTATADVLVTATDGEAGPAVARLGTAHPNPARAGQTVRFDAVGLTAPARLVDARGRTVATVPAAPGAIAVETGALAPGAYTLVVDGDVPRARSLTVVR